MARVVIPGHPHHVTQRGNARAPIFFGDADYALYRDLLAQGLPRGRSRGLAWCLMPNHMHLILVPSDPDGLRRSLARVHRAYAGVIQARRKRSGHFWQRRFCAIAMEEDHLAAAQRSVSLNPMRARLVRRPRRSAMIAFSRAIERLTGRVLKPGKRGPKSAMDEP